MKIYLKFRSVEKFVIYAKKNPYELKVPGFNWKNLPKATVKGGDDHILIRLKSKGRPLEGQITQVKKEGDIVGFVIPGAALLSDSHRYAKNPMFGPYALIALKKLVDEARARLKDFNSDLSWKDVVDDGFYYCVINAERCSVIDEDDFLDKFFVQLMEAGFVDGNIAGKAVIRTLGKIEAKNAIYLNKSRKENVFVRKVFFSMIPYEHNPFFSFFYAWQVVEHFMQLEFESRLNEFIEKYDPKRGVVEAKKGIEKITEISKEKNRVGSVFQRKDGQLNSAIDTFYSSIQRFEQDELIGVNNPKTAEEGLVDEKESTVKEDYAAKLYHIRNIMFHSFSNIESQLEAMQGLIESLSLYLIGKCGNSSSAEPV